MGDTKRTTALTALVPAFSVLVGCGQVDSGSERKPELVGQARQQLPEVEGQWSAPICWPAVAVHVIHLHTGKILTWPNTSGSPDFLEVWLWDPEPECFGDQGFPDPNCFRRVDNVETNLFCAGHAALPDGRILTTGGHHPDIGNHNGLRDANIFDPETEIWLGQDDGVEEMEFPRWYPTSTALGDGRLLTVAGTQRLCVDGPLDGEHCHNDSECLGGFCTIDPSVEVIRTPELFDPNAGVAGEFTSLNGPGAQLALPIYAEMFLLPDGRVFFAGAEGAGGGIEIGAYDNRALDIATQTWTPIATSSVPGASAAMYEPGKVLKVGGNAGGALATAGAQIIDLTSTGAGVWENVPDMQAGRLFSNLVLLPDGTVMVSGGTRSNFNQEYDFFCVGGTTPGRECSPPNTPPGRPGLSCPRSFSGIDVCGGDGTCTGGSGTQYWVSEVEIFDPVTRTWSQVAHMATPRQYHSSTILLPDGRVLSSGGGQGSGAIHDYATIELFSPPYLFKGPRPTVTSSPAAVDYAQTFDVVTPDAATIAKASLIRLAGTTHGTDQNARFVPLTFASHAGSVEITGARVGGVGVPISPNVAPPGYYMLFLVNSAGVPSIGRYVRLGDGPLAQCKDVTVNTDAGTCSAAGVSIDDGSFDPGGSAITVSQAPAGPYGLGSTDVELTATDADGRADTCHGTVTVEDHEPPAFTSVPADVTTTTCGSLAIGSAIAQDACAGFVSVTNDAPAQFPPGTTIVTWTATDARGNGTTATQRVTVVLTDNPACCPSGSNVILGTPNNDTLNGTGGSDCILGRGGQDVINGNAGNDFISGGDGNDDISGGTGNDVVFGGSGQDSINGGNDDDSLSGGDGDDTVIGGSGNDTLNGGQGQDTLQGQDGSDRLFGDDGDDNLQGGNGNDDLIGGVNNDTCNGGGGANTFAQCEFGAPNSCADGVGNGTETGVDCGGACPDCMIGGTCNSGADCAGGTFCVAGTCQSPPGSMPNLLQTQLTFSTDWGGGYCAVLNVTNNASVFTTTFTASLQTNASTIYTSWNGVFSGASGMVTVTPAFSWNSVIDPGETDSSIGFCANRTVPGSGTLPQVVGTSGSF